jgi:hypothetical protein
MVLEQDEVIASARYFNPSSIHDHVAFSCLIDFPELIPLSMPVMFIPIPK